MAGTSVYKKLLEIQRFSRDFYIDEIRRHPNMSGCFTLSDKWFYYSFDERMNLDVVGPFSNRGIIYTCALKNGLDDIFGDYEFNEDELKIYVENHYRSFDSMEEFKSMVSSLDILKFIKRDILDGREIPNRVSHLVIRKDNGILYLAVFVIFFTFMDVSNRTINRPTLWAKLDFKTGEVIERVNIRDEDFSSCNYNDKIKISSRSLSFNSYFTNNYRGEALKLLDDVRYEYINKNVFNKEKYIMYLDRILENTPEEYRVFYKDLSV